MRERVLNKATKITEARVAGVCLVVLLSCLLLPVPSRADSPTEQVRATVDKVLILVRDSSRKSAGQKQDLRAQLAEVIYPRFDFAEMANVLEEYMNGRQFVVGDRVTVGDFVVAYTLDWAKTAKVSRRPWFTALT